MRARATREKLVVRSWKLVRHRKPRLKWAAGRFHSLASARGLVLLRHSTVDLRPSRSTPARACGHILRADRCPSGGSH